MDPDVRNNRKLGVRGKELFDRINSENLLKNIWQVSINSILIAIINLIFHFIMSRNLGPADYGELETLLTINSLLLIGLSAVSLITTRFASIYRSRQQFDKMKYLANWAFIFFLLIGMSGFIINFIFSKITAQYLKIPEYQTIIIFGMLIWISFLMPIIEGVLRGLQEFSFVGKYRLLDAFLKLAIAGTLVYLGFRIKSIIIGIIIASIIAIIFTGYILKKLYINRPYRIDLKEIYSFAIPAFLSTIAFSVLTNIDLVLVKHFFDPHTTGLYAAAAILAKLTVLLAFGSAGVMFPKIVEDYVDGNTKNTIKIFRDTLKIAIIGGFLVTLLIILFPETISKAFFGPQYEIANLLVAFSIAMFLLSITSIIMMYDLACRKYTHISIMLVAAFITIYQINMLHQTLEDVIYALLIINALVLAIMIYINKRELFAKI